jgi:hypothetical protein
LNWLRIFNQEFASLESTLPLPQWVWQTIFTELKQPEHELTSAMFKNVCSQTSFPVYLYLMKYVDSFKTESFPSTCK